MTGVLLAATLTGVNTVEEPPPPPHADKLNKVSNTNEPRILWRLKNCMNIKISLVGFSSQMQSLFCKLKIHCMDRGKDQEI